MPAPAEGSRNQHPLREAAQRAASAAAERIRTLEDQRARLRAGFGTSVADALEAEVLLDAARGRQHEADRRLVTTQLARAHRIAAHQEFLAVARRLARLTLAEDVRRRPLDP